MVPRLSLPARLRLVCLALVALRLTTAAPASAPSTVEQWTVFELALPGPADGNPLVDVTLSARFTRGVTKVGATGFYDGDGVYRVRFMPTQQVAWRCETRSNRDELNARTGQFTAAGPSPDNRGTTTCSRTLRRRS